jgi:hypothetical protein
LFISDKILDLVEATRMPVSEARALLQANGDSIARATLAYCAQQQAATDVQQRGQTSRTAQPPAVKGASEKSTAGKKRDRSEVEDEDGSPGAKKKYCSYCDNETHNDEECWFKNPKKKVKKFATPGPRVAKF